MTIAPDSRLAVSHAVTLPICVRYGGSLRVLPNPVFLSASRRLVLWRVTGLTEVSLCISSTQSHSHYIGSSLTVLS